MTAQQELDQLKQKREEYVRISKENNMYEGTKKILTDMYPDTAHFIYELLQNAEDMHASKVKFKLSKDKLVFYHNGTKRDFIIEDIDSITSIGNNSLKRDDKTSIGKFGVGFKAVYTYTRTPEIHSGEFDFRIKDMFVPDGEGVKKVAQPGKTVFVFPFDHETKTPEQAVKEIQTGLLELDENSVLFLRHIKLIEFTLPNEQGGGIKLFDEEEVRKKIVRIDINDKKHVTYWYKFTTSCAVLSAGKRESYPISIAYKAKKATLESPSEYTIDSNLRGNVCIYFPAVKEDSRLHFHINAPFASTVARDSVRSCDENKTLIEGLSRLVVDSIHYFKEQKMVNLDLYATLPNRRDFEHSTTNTYAPIYFAITKLFASEELIITDQGEYKKAGAVMQTNREIASLLPSSVMEELYHRSWIPALNPQSRELYFLQDYNIQSYERRDIADALRFNPNWFDGVFSNNINNNDWFKLWFALLNDIVGLNSYIHAFEKVRMVKCDDGNLHLPTDDIFIRDPNYKPVNTKKPLYVSLEEAKNQTTERAKSFLKWLGVKVLDEHADIMSDIEGKSTVDADDVTLALMSVVEMYKAGQDISTFIESKLFLGRSYDASDSLYCLKASECCWDRTVGFYYQDEDCGYVIDLSCYNAFSPEELKDIKAVFAKLGGITDLKIEKTSLFMSHPQYSQLDTNGERWGFCTKVDYTIPGIKRISTLAEEKLIDETILLWNCIVKDKNIDHHIATYKANGSRRTQTLESTLAYYLRRIDWIPDKDGVFHRPCDIKEAQLHEGFVYSKDAVFLNNLGFGDESKAPNDVARILEKAGVRVSEEDKFWFSIPEEEKRMIMESARNRKEREKLSLEEALDRENREQTGGEELDDYGRDISVKRAEERARKQREEFEKGLDAESKRFRTWHYTYGSKTTSEEKAYVFHQYHGKCQICGKAPIRMHNGKNYFVAVNIIDTSRLEDKYLIAIDKGWNTLCLCPNCAAEYRHCSKSLAGVMEQIRDTKVESGRNDYIELTFVLKGNPTKIQFTPRHFIALQAAFEVFREHEDD